MVLVRQPIRVVEVSEGGVPAAACYSMLANKKAPHVSGPESFHRKWMETGALRNI